MLADYHLIRRYKLRVNDLYTGDSTSIYWFRNGVNWRALVAFLLGMWPLLRTSPKFSSNEAFWEANFAVAGLVATVNGYTKGQWVGWTRLYNLTFLVGLAMSFGVFWVLSYFSQPVGLGREASFAGVEIVDGHADSGSEAMKEKDLEASEKRAMEIEVV